MNCYIECDCGKWISVLNHCEMNDHADHYNPQKYIRLKWIV